MRLIFVTLLLIGTTAAQDACPVKMSDLNFYFNPVGDLMHVKLANTTSKTITAVAFGVTWYDTAQIARESPELLEHTIKLKPGKEMTFRYRGEIYGPYGERQGGSKLFLRRAVFDDGSIWQDDGEYNQEHRCYAPDYKQEKFEATKKAGN